MMVSSVCRGACVVMSSADRRGLSFYDQYRLGKLYLSENSKEPDFFAGKLRVRYQICT
jgi:hypothetical protein